MNYKEAINASQIWAARGYDEKNVCVVSVCFYGEKTLWLTGFGGNWTKKWAPLDEADTPEELEERYAKLRDLRFAPTGPKPDDQIAAELLDVLGGVSTAETPVTEEQRAALEEIADDYAWADENKDDYFEPMGETYE